MGGPKAVQKGKRTAESILQRLVFQSWKGVCWVFFFFRGDENRTMTYDVNHINLIGTLEDYNLPVGRTFQDFSLVRKPVFNI